MNEIEKAQWIRLYVDVLFLGPFMIYLGLTKKLHPVEKGILYFFGGSTIAYNLKNYLKQRQSP